MQRPCSPQTECCTCRVRWLLRLASSATVNIYDYGNSGGMYPPLVSPRIQFEADIFRDSARRHGFPQVLEAAL